MIVVQLTGSLMPSYGKTHKKKSTRGMPSFAVNTKLGTGNL